ncbi:MAG: response regulator [Candidatus Scalindua sp.]
MKGKKILLIEDDPDHAELIIDILEEEDVENEVILMKDGQDVIDYLQDTGSSAGQATQPNDLAGRAQDVQPGFADGNGKYSQIVLIILDLNLPVVNGMDVLRFIKRSPEYCSIPVIIVSASHDTEAISEAFKNGANGFITKSYLYEKESFENTGLLREYCKSALSEDFSTK